MEKIAIITDSGSDLKEEYRKENNIFVLPIQISCDGKTYRDGIDISSKEIYQLQKEHMLKTSSPVGQELFSLLESLKVNGYSHVIGIFLSAGISGTSNQMRLFCQSQEDLVCHIIDSKSASVGLGIIAIELAHYCQKGVTFEQAISYGEKFVEENYAYFSIDDLGFLQKGGRIGKASAFLGTTLKIKPILSFEKENGEIYVPSKVRGNKKVKSKLVELIEKHFEDHSHQKFALSIADGNNLEERNELEKMLKEKFPTLEYIIDAHVGAALSCYLGSGLLGVAIQFI